MNILFVHQNFPGQFKHLAPHLVRAGHHVKALGMGGTGLPDVPLLRYGLQRGPGTDTHPLAKDFEAKVVRGEACAHIQVRAGVRTAEGRLRAAEGGRGG